MRTIALGICLALAAAPAAAAGPKPLFASDDTIHIAIQGPMNSFFRNRSDTPHAGTLTIGTEKLPINLTVRGITRRMGDVCDFPPLRVEFTTPPPPTSLFAGQKKLKLVTHCRGSVGFQQYLLLEYSAYKMYQQLTPLGLRARLADITYNNDDGKLAVQRYGFFLEDVSDAAKRNGLKELKAPATIAVESISPRDGARYALFQHMLGNHDWSMRAGPKGDFCCHNAKLIGASGLATGTVIPIPYDFDFSGFVNPPYATPPEELHISDVKQRYFRGYCIHNSQAMAVAAQMRAARPQLLAALTSTPGLDAKTLGRAQSYLDGFFKDIASDASTAALLKHCVG
jgi:hypothetical protein